MTRVFWIVGLFRDFSAVKISRCFRDSYGFRAQSLRVISRYACRVKKYKLRPAQASRRFQSVKHERSKSCGELLKFNVASCRPRLFRSRITLLLYNQLTFHTRHEVEYLPRSSFLTVLLVWDYTYQLRLNSSTRRNLVSFHEANFAIYTQSALI